MIRVPQIEALDSSAPQIAVLETLWKVELLKDGRYGIFISSRELKAQDKNSADGDLIYHILRPPYFGYLENYTNGERSVCLCIRLSRSSLPVCNNVFTSCIIVDMSVGEFVRHRFSQRDLNRRNILYVINSALDSLTDSLEFAVSDALGKSGLSHK